MNAFDIESATGESNPLLHRRLNNLGAASVLFYQSPIEIVSGHGAWMVAADGSKYLDFYNNVPSVGHCHAKVVQAVSEQIAKLNIHTRYLSSIVDDYIENLKVTLPDHLDNLLLCCTGSEANDLALRLAKKKSGNKGFIVTETAYHGNTLAVTEISPATLKHDSLPDHVIAIPAPSTINYGDDIVSGFKNAMEQAINTLNRRGYGIAAFICDSIFSSDGVLSHPAGFLKPTIDLVHKKGGCYIADEVQPGFGRTGRHMWGFQHHDVLPDFVTMGKPMGNGFPMAGMAANNNDVKKFCESVGYFNTFGGNPVAAAAGQAVLDVIQNEGLIEHSEKMGRYIRDELKNIQSSLPVISDIRGSGLFIGVDLCIDGDPAQPDPTTTVRTINRLKEKHILIGASGKYGHTLKLRPPLCLNQEEADIFLQAIQEVLKD